MLMQDIEVDKSIIINGAKNIEGVEGVSLKAKGKIAMIRLEKNVDHFDISNIQFDGNEISSEGIGIGRNSYRKDMDIKIEDCKFEKFEGSALRLSYDSKINKADIDILNSQFKSINDNNNTKNGSSGIVEVRAIRTDLNVENSVFDNNTSSMGSAGIRVLNDDDKTEKDSLGNINITGSEFKNSSTKDEVSGNGGILYSNNCNIKMTDVFIDNNSSTENGGAIFAASHGSKEKAKLILDTLNEDNNIISNNFIKERYSARGGAITLFGNIELEAYNTTFKGNKSDVDGGAVSLASPTRDKEIRKSKFNNVKFIENESGDYGGAVDLHGNQELEMKNIEFLSNKEIEEVPDGGGSGGGGSGGGSTTDDKKTTAILANGKKYTDVLTATVLAHEKKCPILLTDTNSISKETMDELKRRGIGQIIISGGELSVSKNVVNQLGDFDVVRYSGHNRYETAREIARQVRLESGNTNEAVLVDGTNFPDVITVSALASQKRAPILLTETNKLNLVTENIVKEWLIDDITIAGQTKSVSENVENRIEAILKDSPKKIVRIGGHDRYETASLIGNEVRKLIGNKKDMILVDGTNFPDGITVNSLASKFECPIHLTNPNTLTDITKKDISSWKVENILVAGGNISVSDKIYKNLDVKNKERISGHSRYMTAVEISKRFDESKMLIKK